VFDAPEAASQTFRIGAPLILSVVSGHENEVKVAGNDPVVGILGVAAENATGVQGSRICYWIAEPGVEFVGRIQDAAVIAYTQKGIAYGIVFDAVNGIWRLDSTDTTNVNTIVTDLVDAAGDINGRLAFQWKASARLPFLG
jgi:hypothetical protein